MSPNLLFWSLAATTAAGTAIGVEMMRRWGARRLLDLPNARSSHTRPTPRGGGLPLVVVAVGCWLVYLATTESLRWVGYLPLAIGAMVVALVSWLDDVHTLRFKTRLLVHLAAAALILSRVAPPASVQLGDLGALPLGVLAWPLALLWIAGMANAFNFMDGIDGIAGGQGLVAGLAWLVLGWEFLNPSIGVLGGLLAVACAVFLCFNWSPARIFMGDVGSATLGFVFAALPFCLGSWGPSPTWVPGAAIVWPFVFDAGFTLVRRWRRGEQITEAHRSHLYQRLVIAGWSHARVSSLYIGWAVTTSVAGWAMAKGMPLSGLVGLGWAVLSGVGVWRLTLGVERTRA